jgi:TatD DNase family protein
LVTLADTHCHLDFEAFEADRQQVLARGLEAGVERILNPGINLTSTRAAIKLAESYPQVFAAAGIHPNEATTWEGNTQSHLRELAQHPKVVAVGEIGLDYYRDRAPRPVQQRIFQEQLDLAAELGLPVVIHNRQATEDVLMLIANWHNKLVSAGSPLAERPGVLHSYANGENVARQAIALNFYIGFTGPVTFRNAPELQRVVASLPVDRLLVETDAPFLTPHPHRGQRNEPAYVRLVAEKIAELHQENFARIADRTTANAKRLFDW